MHGGESLRQNVVDELAKRAEGNFLWVTLAVKEISQVLKATPDGMDSLYQRMEATI
jgi:hypothetical protein